MKKIQKKVSKQIKTPPTGIKILSVLNYISAGFSWLIAFLLLIFGLFFASVLYEIPELSLFEINWTWVLVVGAVILGLLGVLYFFIGRGLWKGQNWSRIIYIIFVGLGFIFSIIYLFLGDWLNLISLIIDGLICGYLIFSKKVQAFFK